MFYSQTKFFALIIILIFLNILMVFPQQSPMAVDDVFTISEDTITSLDVMANDSDPDADPLSLVSVSDPPNGEASIISGNMVEYIPDPDYFGLDPVYILPCFQK